MKEYRWYHSQALMLITLLFVLPLGLVLLWITPRYSRMRKTMYTLLWLVLGVLTFPFAFLFWVGFLQTVHPSFIFSDTEALFDNHELSQDQSLLLTLFGIPDDYLIEFVYLNPTNPAAADRIDSWNFYGRGKGYVYSNGVCTATFDLNPADLPERQHPVIHSPREYQRGFTWQEMLNEHGQQLYLAYPEDTSYRTVYDGNMLLGFENGLLTSVHTEKRMIPSGATP